MKVETRGILIGMALGDAYVNVRLRGGYVSSEMRVLHSVSQADYCEHKAGLIKQHLGGNFSVTYGWHGPGKKYRCCAFSVSNPYFRQIKEWVYPGGKKTISERVLQMLTPEGMAVWYMDDGHARINRNKQGWISSVATQIATMCSKEEAEIAQTFFKKEYGVLFNLRFYKKIREGKQFLLETNTEGSREFIGIVQPYIIPSMAYKIAHVANLGLHETRAPLAFCVNCQAPIYDPRRKGLCCRCYSRKYYREVVRFREGRNSKKKDGTFYKGDEIVRPCEKNESQELQDKEPEG
jgi:hypothetical protein